MDDSGKAAIILVCVAVFLIASAYVYWRTSPTYKLRETKKRLGYDVEGILTMVGKGVKKLAGASNKPDYEKKSKLFRTPDYGPPDPG